MVGKALRGFASQGMLNEIKRLFKYFSPNLIIDQRDNNPEKRNTTFHLALEFGHDDVATFLKDQGADVNIRNAKGIMPAQLVPYHHMQP